MYHVRLHMASKVPSDSHSGWRAQWHEPITFRTNGQSLDGNVCRIHTKHIPKELWAGGYIEVQRGEWYDGRPRWEWAAGVRHDGSLWERGGQEWTHFTERLRY